MWSVSCVSLALLLFTLLEKQNQRNTERTEQYLAASRAAAEYSNSYSSFEVAADVTASVIESWIPVCCVADATANGWPDGYNKHVNKALSSTSSAVRLKEASAAADDGPAYIADGNRAISDELRNLDGAVLKLINLSDGFHDAEIREAAVEVAKCGREVYSSLEARQALWEELSSSQLQFMRTITKSGGSIAAAMSIAPPDDNFSRHWRDQKEETKAGRRKCGDAFAIFKAKAARIRF